MLSRRAFMKMGIVAVALGVAPSLAACTRNEKIDNNEGKETCEFFAFDTVITMSAYCEQSLLDEMQSRCEYFESIFSRTLEGSDVYRINAAAGAPVQVADETADIITKALEYCKTSGGLFDITIGCATSLWDFNEGIVAPAEELAEAITHIDYTKVRVDGNTVTLEDPAAKIDLGGIAKGYIADDLAQRFRDADCDGAFINLGGNVYALGTRRDGTPWNTGIQNPEAPTGVPLGVVSQADKSIVSSGLYEREFEVDGVIYYHILDPKTGYPVITDLLGSTVISDSSIDGDAYSTILFLQGAQAALQTIESHPEFEGLVITSDGEELDSSNLEMEHFEQKA